MAEADTSDNDVKTYTGKCHECGFTVTATTRERVPHVCPHTLNKHTLNVK